MKEAPVKSVQKPNIMYMGVRSIADVELLMGDAVADAGSGVSAYPAESYEAGVAAVLQWLLDPTAEHPFEWETST